MGEHGCSAHAHTFCTHSHREAKPKGHPNWGRGGGKLLKISVCPRPLPRNMPHEASSGSTKRNQTKALRMHRQPVVQRFFASTRAYGAVHSQRRHRFSNCLLCPGAGERGRHPFLVQVLCAGVAVTGIVCNIPQLNGHVANLLLHCNQYVCILHSKIVPIHRACFEVSKLGLANRNRCVAVELRRSEGAELQRHFPQSLSKHEPAQSKDSHAALRRILAAGSARWQGFECAGYHRVVSRESECGIDLVCRASERCPREHALNLQFAIMRVCLLVLPEYSCVRLFIMSRKNKTNRHGDS